MASKNILIVTPYSEFGELVGRSLEKNTTWKVNSVKVQMPSGLN